MLIISEISGMIKYQEAEETGSMKILEMTEVTDEVVAALQRLIPQLTEHSTPPDWEALAQMASSPDSTVFLACEPDESGEIIGSATLAIAYSPTGAHGWIEDVVVDQAARGQGIGRMLTQSLLDRAGVLGLKQVYLTSRPSRVAANQLYQSMGFIRRETNVYRYDLD
jgi:ribosomal protein S18 acetylase RimI-like enzyme